MHRSHGSMANVTGGVRREPESDIHQVRERFPSSDSWMTAWRVAQKEPCKQPRSFFFPEL